MDLLDLKGCGPKSNRSYIYVFVVINNPSKFGWTIPLKNEILQTMKVLFDNMLETKQKKTKFKRN